jgi:hypothetical protein
MGAAKTMMAGTGPAIPMSLDVAALLQLASASSDNWRGCASVKVWSVSGVG